MKEEIQLNGEREMKIGAWMLDSGVEYERDRILKLMDKINSVCFQEGCNGECVETFKEELKEMIKPKEDC